MQVLQRVALACVLVLVACVAGCGEDPSGTGGSGGTAGAPGGVFCNGFTCAPGQLCVNNVCTTPCTMDVECPGAACCAGACIPTTADRLNCGGCGVVCAANQVCTAGMCTGVTCNTPAPIPPAGDDGGVDDDAGVDMPPVAPPIGANGCPQNEQCAVNTSGTAGVCQCGASPSCPDDQPCGTDSACHCGTGPACTAGSICCGGTTCANLLTDALNCGACGQACPSGQTCSNGVCGCATTSETVCDDGCHNLQTDTNNCGSCGNVCPTEATCSSGKCVCPTPGEIGCGTECVAPNTDEHCGGCDGCPNAGSGGASCQDLNADGAFECSCATEDEAECGGTCKFITTNSNCGACGNACENGKTSCQDTGDGSLGCLCTGYPNVQLCDDGAGGTACINVQANDEDNCGGCGITCVAGDSCVSGACDCASGFPGEIFCDRGTSGDPADYACADPIDRQHCFACDNTCPNDATCSGTEMDCVCMVTTKDFCDGTCIDTATDEANCGDCDVTCSGTDQCDDGKCCPTATPDNCSDVCVDTKTDENNCGTCGNDCGGSETCCNGSCVDLTMDRLNCGACGTMCGASCGGFLGIGGHPCACEAGPTCET